MPFQQILDGAETSFEEVEALLDKIDAGEIQVAEDVEAELREIFMDLADRSDFKRAGAVLLLSFASRRTQAARRRALRLLGKWATDAERRFRVANLDKFRLQGKVLSEMRDLQNEAVRSWTELVRGISTEGSTAAQIAEGKALSKSTAALRKKFAGFNRFLDGVTGKASTGKAENIIAVIGRGGRDAENFLDEFTRGAPLGQAGVVEALDLMVDRVVESTMRDLTDFIRGFQFNRNALRLSSTSHGRGVFNASQIAIAQALGVTHFMGFVTKANRLRSRGTDRDQDFAVRLGSIQGGHATIARMLETTANVRGETVDETRKEEQRRCRLSGSMDPKTRREMLTRMIQQAEPASRKTWGDLFADASRDRQLSISWGGTLGLHPGSRLWFVPIPSSLLSEARSLSRERRKAA